MSLCVCLVSLAPCSLAFPHPLLSPPCVSCVYLSTTPCMCFVLPVLVWQSLVLCVPCSAFSVSLVWILFSCVPSCGLLPRVHIYVCASHRPLPPSCVLLPVFQFSLVFLAPSNEAVCLCLGPILPALHTEYYKAFLFWTLKALKAKFSHSVKLLAFPDICLLTMVGP